MGIAISKPEVAPPVAWPSTEAVPTSLTLGAYLAAVAATVAAGMPQQSWVEATVAAAKPGPYGHALQLLDPAGGASAPTMRAFLRTADRDAITRRLGAPLDPNHLVGMTVVALVEPDFHPRWGMGGRIIGLSEALRESLLRRVLEEIRARLKSEGVYGRQHRLPVPPDVVRVVVIHPAGAAGHADVAGELGRWQRAGILSVVSITAAFEGPRAAGELTAALRRAASGDGVPPDVIGILRGGGDKSGLLTLDDEAVARAVCLCPIPVIAGLGHQVDSTLVDEVAAVTCDTPSKALAHLGGLVVGPARRARANMAAVMMEAERRVATAGHEVDAARSGLHAMAERRLATNASALAAAGAGVEAAVAGASKLCVRLGDEAGRLLQLVRERAPLRLDEPGHHVERLVGTAMAGARRRLEQADDGRALIGTVSSRATARLESASLAIVHRHDALPLDAARRVTDAGVDLARLAGTVETLGLDATLKRGFVVATTVNGALVPTRAAALAAGDLILTFADGAVSAGVGASLTTANTIGEAA